LRSVVAEECHWTVLAYVELLDAERMEAVGHMDAQYHLGKLIAAAFNDPERIWSEHEEFRSSALTPALSTPRALLEARALALFQRTRTTQPNAGAN
jgi:hypothetical protein